MEKNSQKFMPLPYPIVKYHNLRWAWFFIVFLLLFLIQSNIFAAQSKAMLLTINGPIGPATASYIKEGVATAHVQNAALIILQINTPGGLDSAMREVIIAILNSPLPVIGYVAPSGARAASAGTYLLYACHLAAMAPGTNLGAATPVAIDGSNLETQKSNSSSDLANKAKNDATAYIHALAELRGRNAPWAEKAVLQSESITDTEALKLGVINTVAINIPNLLTQIDGQSVTVQGKIYTLDTRNLIVVPIKPNWQTEFLMIITDPSIAYVLLLIGIYGLFFEFISPGMVAPGVIGTISFLVALYGLQLLPINYVGLGLILLGIGFMIAEVFLPTFGSLGIGGAIAFAIGSVMLLNKETTGYTLPWQLILAVTFTSALFFLFIATVALRARKQPQSTGRAATVGHTGYAMDQFTSQGLVMVDGEIWQAETILPIHKGQKVHVLAIKGLVLTVKPISKNDN